MNIYTEIRADRGVTVRDSAIHQTAASAAAWLAFKLCDDKSWTGRFYGRNLTSSERQTILAAGKVEQLP